MPGCMSVFVCTCEIASDCSGNGKGTHPFSVAILGLFILTDSTIHDVCKRKKIKTSLTKMNKRYMFKTNQMI